MNNNQDKEQQNFYKNNSISLKINENTNWIFCFDNEKMCQNVDYYKKEIEFNIKNCKCNDKLKIWKFTIKNKDRPITFFDLCVEFMRITKNYKPCKHNFIEDFTNGDFQYD